MKLKWETLTRHFSIENALDSAFRQSDRYAIRHKVDLWSWRIFKSVFNHREKEGKAQIELSPYSSRLAGAGAGCRSSLKLA